MNNNGTLAVAKIEDRRPQPTAVHVISYVLDGFLITSTIETSTPIRQIVDRLKAIGATTPASKTEKSSTTPLCPAHGTPMKASRKPGSYFCPRRGDDGDYCPHRS